MLSCDLGSRYCTLPNLGEALGHFTFWISLSLRPKTETKRLNFDLSPEFRLTNHCGAQHCSLHSVIADVIADISVFLCLFTNKRKSEVIFVHQNLISNWLTYLVYEKSTGEFISFGFNDRSVRSLVSAIALRESLSPNEKRLHFSVDLWSQSEFRSQRKTDPKSETTQCMHLLLRQFYLYGLRWILTCVADWHTCASVCIVYWCDCLHADLAWLLAWALFKA